MTTIQALPEEVLYMIFDNLFEVSKFQYVCKAWYLPAHLTLLKRIKLNTPEDIKRFNRSIDSNPNPAYLKAVKSINIGRMDVLHSEYRFDKETIRKTLLRFPNLKWATFAHCLTFLLNFDDDICNELVKNCPNLEVYVFILPCIQSPYTSEEFNAVLQRVRLLVTILNLDLIENPPNGLIQFVTSFPRLREITGSARTFPTLEDWVPVVEKLDSFQRFHVTEERDNAEKIAEKYLVGKTEQDKHRMIRKLANIKTVTMVNRNSFLFNSCKFIAKYLTGLSTLTIVNNLSRAWTDTKQRMFYDIVVNFAQTVDTCDITLSMTRKTMSKYLPLVVYKLFNQLPKDDTPSVMIVRMLPGRQENQAALRIRTNKKKHVREIEVGFKFEQNPFEVAKYIHKGTIFNNADEFRFLLLTRSVSEYEVDVASYEKLMGEMPSLKKVILDVPASFRETDLSWNSTFPQVKQVTIQASTDSKFQSLLDNCQIVFPNLKYLNLYYFSGIWHRSSGEFRIDLGQYKLRRLIVDVTAVHEKMEDKIGEDNEIDEIKAFFVIVVEFLASGKRQLYKVNFKLKSVDRIHDEDLKGLVRGESYLRVYITVTSLEMLELCKAPDRPKHALREYLDATNAFRAYRTLIDLKEP